MSFVGTFQVINVEIREDVKVQLTHLNDAV